MQDVAHREYISARCAHHKLEKVKLLQLCIIDVERTVLNNWNPQAYISLLELQNVATEGKCIQEQLAGAHLANAHLAPYPQCKRITPNLQISKFA